MNLLLLADARVGSQIAEWLFGNFPQDISLLVTMADNDIATSARERGVPSVIFESEEQVHRAINQTNVVFDLGISAWWPKIIRAPLLQIPRNGFVNTHPSLLPYCRGKHYNFWALVEQAPFGVTLHTLDQGVDTGDIVAQLPISYGWEDTGESLYKKAGAAMVRLFCETYPMLRSGTFEKRPQDLSIGSFHRAAELEAASEIVLEQSYRARDLLNLIRARTFHGHPACFFSDDGIEYEVRIEIARKAK